jgi:hypothetical protein
MAVTTGTRPADIDGCWASWSESQEPNVIRTEMDATGYIKTRRRTTGIMRMAEVSRTFEAKLYQDFLDWYNVACQQGVIPTKVMTPYGKEEIWRFTEPPQITWPDTKAFTVSCKLEQLPAWR